MSILSSQPKQTITNAKIENDRCAETESVRSDPELMAEIQRGLEAIKQGQTKLYTLAELFND